MPDFEQWADEAIAIVSGDVPPESPGPDDPPAPDPRLPGEPPPGTTSQR